jgi:gamma-glutamylcyclotransferase (GGCT)/AIG2-like uncharacterized protein YtfP
VSGAETVSLFAYGTLRQENVQRATFGRSLDGRADALPGFALSPLEIADPAVIATSGLAVHTAARRTGNPDHVVPGTVFLITPTELDAADRYEVDEMVRIEAKLASGATAFLYVRREPD